jgi:hypothetical protein
MFTDKDREKFDKALETMAKIGEKVGIHINKKGSWVLRTMIIGGSLLVFGLLIFIWSMLRKSIGEKD